MARGICWHWGGCWEGNRWEGRPQEVDKSPENIRACFRFLRRVPYQTTEDRERLRELELLLVTEAQLLEGP